MHHAGPTRATSVQERGMFGEIIKQESEAGGGAKCRRRLQTAGRGMNKAIGSNLKIGALHYNWSGQRLTCGDRDLIVQHITQCRLYSLSHSPTVACVTARDLMAVFACRTTVTLYDCVHFFFFTSKNISLSLAWLVIELNCIAMNQLTVNQSMNQSSDRQCGRMCWWLLEQSVAVCGALGCGALGWM